MSWMILLGQVLGVVLIVAGIAMWSLPAAVLTLGVIMLAVSLLVERGRFDVDPDG